MGPLLRIPVIRSLHDRELLFPVVVVLVVSGVLVQGVWQGDPPVETVDQVSAPAPLPPPVSRRPDLEKTPLTYFDDYWRQLRERVEDRVVLVGPARTPAVVVMPGLALTSAEAGEAVLAEVERARLVRPPLEAPTHQGSDAGASATPPGGAEGEASPVESGVEDPDPEQSPAPRPGGLIAVDRDLGLSLFEVDATRVEAFALIPPAAVPSGAYVAAVTRDRTGRAAITPGHLVSARAEPAGQSFEVSMRLAGPGATAVVDLDGALVGIAVDVGEVQGGPRLLSSSAVRRVVAGLQRQVPCRALVVSALAPPVLALLGIDGGVLVERVRQDAFMPEPSLHAGDVILEWAGQAMTTVEAFEALTDTLDLGALVRYRVLRGRRQLAGGTVLPGDDCRPVGEPPVRLARFGLALRWTTGGGAAAGHGWRVAATAPDGAAETAGLLPDDLVLAVDGGAAEGLGARAVFERMERRGEPTLMTVRRADRVRILALDPGDDDLER